MENQWRIAPYDPAWRHLFSELGKKLRGALGEAAVRIDHVGSTSIPGMDAKPIIDVQVSVAALQDVARYRDKIESVGFMFREDNPDLTKKYFREAPGTRRTHIHVRQAGSWSEQLTLLFRDYLREHPQDCQRYAAEKHRLMQRFQHEREKYVEGKGPVVWEILQRAHDWSQATGWTPPKSDA